MKYKSKKYTSPKYVTQTSKKDNIKKSVLKKQVAASILFVAVMFSLSGLGIVKRPVVKSVFGYVSRVSQMLSPQKIKSSAFLKSVGNNIYDFCFGYLKQDDQKNTKVYAVNETLQEPLPKTEEQAKETALEPDLAESPNVQPQLAEQPKEIFEPIWPINGEITSEFGNRVHPVSGESRFHNGTDIAANEGDEIRACEDGIVETATYNKYSGNYVVIVHQNGFASSYSHMSKLLAVQGAEVKKGDLIGLAGSTGIATGPHLHFEIKENGLCKNPKDFIKE